MNHCVSKRLKAFLESFETRFANLILVFLETSGSLHLTYLPQKIKEAGSNDLLVLVWIWAHPLLYQARKDPPTKNVCVSKILTTKDSMVPLA